VTKQTTEERMAIMETKLDIVINNQEKANQKLDLLLPTFATTEELSVTKHDLEKKITQSRSSRLKDLIIQALVIGSISALLGYFFANITQ